MCYNNPVIYEKTGSALSAGMPWEKTGNSAEKRDDMQEFKPVKEGKVREIYDIGENLVIVATDRISCFDVILNNKVEKKGTVLTQMSKFWFDKRFP